MFVMVAGERSHSSQVRVHLCSDQIPSIPEEFLVTQDCQLSRI